MRWEVVALGLALSAVVMISRGAPLALLANRQLHPRLRKLIEVMPGCAIAGFLTIWALPGEGEALMVKAPAWIGGLVGLAVTLPTGRLLIGMLAGLSVAAAVSLVLSGS